jgi:hypothetical protein
VTVLRGSVVDKKDNPDSNTGYGRSHIHAGKSLTRTLQNCVSVKNRELRNHESNVKT